MPYERGTVVKGPDLFADYDSRPYVCLSDDSHPFSDEEALYVTATTTRRAVAIPPTDGEFTDDSPKEVRTIPHVASVESTQPNPQGEESPRCSAVRISCEGVHLEHYRSSSFLTSHRRISPALLRSDAPVLGSQRPPMAAAKGGGRTASLLSRTPTD